jgi:hypothetical protein
MPVGTSNQYLLAQQPFHHAQPAHSSTPDFYPPQQGVPMAPVPVPEPQAVLPQAVPTAHAAVHPQHYAHMMQPRYDPNHRPNYMPTDYHPQPPPPPYAGHHPMPTEHHPMMVSYHPEFQYKPAARILNQPEGTDWGFLGLS